MNKRKILWTWRLWSERLKFYRRLLRLSLNRLNYIDLVYATLWDISDRDYILEEYRRIKAGRLRPDSITLKIERAYHDKTVYYDSTYRRVEPQDIRLTIDQLTDDYITWLMKVHTGRLFQTPNYISVGTDATAPSRTQHQLVTEVERKHILDSGGYVDPLGHNELYGLLFPFSQADIDCSEAGLHTTASKTNTNDIMVCRNKFTPALSHRVDQNALGININIQHRAF